MSGVRSASAAAPFLAPRPNSGRRLNREPVLAGSGLPPVATMLWLEDAPEFIILRAPIAPMPTAARTTRAVVSLALDIRIIRSDNVLKVVAAPAVNLAELRLATSWLGAASTERSAKTAPRD